MSVYGLPQSVTVVDCSLSLSGQLHFHILKVTFWFIAVLKILQPLFYTAVLDRHYIPFYCITVCISLEFIFHIYVVMYNYCFQ